MSVPDKKLPWFKFFPLDHLGDSELQGTRASTRGIWWNLLSHMKKRGTGEMHVTVDQIMQFGGCTVGEALLFLVDMAREGACDVAVVTDDGAIAPFVCRSAVTVDVAGTYAVVSRRLSREYHKKKTDRERQDRHRKKGDEQECHAENPRSETLDDERLRARERSEIRDQRSEREGEIVRVHAPARVDEPRPLPRLRPLELELAKAWPNAGLTGTLGSGHTAELAEELERRQMDPNVACKAWRALLTAYAKKGTTVKQVPAKMLEHLRGGLIDQVISGELDLNLVADPRARDRRPTNPRPASVSQSADDVWERIRGGGSQ